MAKEFINGLFTEAKIKMVMRVHRVSREEAIGIIAARAVEWQALEQANRAKGQDGKAKEGFPRLVVNREFFQSWMIDDKTFINRIY